LPLTQAQLAHLEKLSNKLSIKELKALIADRITVDDDSLVAFSEKIYVRAKTTTIMGQMLA